MRDIHRRKTPKSRPDEEPKEKASGPFYGGPMDKRENEKEISKAKAQAEERRKKIKEREKKRKTESRKARKSSAAQPKKSGFGDIPDIVSKGEVDIPESFWVGGNP